MKKSRANTPRESALVREILATYGSLDGVLLWRNNVGAAKDKSGRLIRFGVKGSADILGVVRQRLTVRTVINPNGMQPLERVIDTVVGRAIAIECKRSGEKLSEAQEAWARAWVKAGAAYVLAYDLRDASGFMDRLLENT